MSDSVPQPDAPEEGSFIPVDPDVLRRSRQYHEQRLTRILFDNETAPAAVTITAAKASAKGWARDNGLILSDGSIGAVLPNGRVVRYREGSSFLPIDDTNDALVAVIRQWAEPDDGINTDTLISELEQCPSWIKCLERFPAQDQGETPDQRLAAMQACLNRYGLPYTPAMAQYALSRIDRTEPPGPPTRGGIVTTFLLAISYDLIPKVKDGKTVDGVYESLYQYETLQQVVSPANWTNDRFKDRAKVVMSQHSLSIGNWGREFKERMTGDLRSRNGGKGGRKGDPKRNADVDAHLAGNMPKTLLYERAIQRWKEAHGKEPNETERKSEIGKIDDAIYNRNRRKTVT